jgi:hypothetical protein
VLRVRDGVILALVLDGPELQEAQVLALFPMPVGLLADVDRRQFATICALCRSPRVSELQQLPRILGDNLDNESVECKVAESAAK